jgi:hypothetical protein
MNQAILTLSTAAIKTQIIKQIRELDWSREADSVMILVFLNQLESAKNSSFVETYKLAQLMSYLNHHFNNLETQRKFRELIQTYKALLPRQADLLYKLSLDKEIKNFESDEEDEFDDYIDIQDGDYNPLAAKRNDQLDLMGVQDELSSIESNLDLDWVSEVAPDKSSSIESNVSKVEPEAVTLAPAPTAIFRKKSKLANSDLAHIGKVMGIIAGFLMTAAIMTLVPPAVPFIAVLLYGASTTAAASVAAGVLAAFSCAVCVAIGSLVDYAKNKSSHKQQARISAVNDAVIQDIKETKQSDVVLESAPQNDNIHQDPDLSVKELVETNISQSKHSLFHSTATRAVEPKQLLVQNFSLRR